ncbi:hypothetical protein TRVA0_028S01464 [Trichomonascus vanleenenianus]|uniref:uncharacterized protein n=1 Tax=Trichomonascus vanleenenianus TaxID=2268995 RepID=UPI003ECBADBB
MFAQMLLLVAQWKELEPALLQLLATPQKTKTQVDSLPKPTPPLLDDPEPEEFTAVLKPVPRTHSCLNTETERQGTSVSYCCELGSYNVLLYENPSCQAQLKNQITSFSRRDPFDRLPEKITITILEYLGPRAVLRASMVCRNWCRLGRDNILWKNMVPSLRLFMPYSLPMLSDWRKVYTQKQKMYHVFKSIVGIKRITRGGHRASRNILTDSILVRLNLSGQVMLFDCANDVYYPRGRDSQFYSRFSRDITMLLLSPMTTGKLDNAELILSFLNGELVVVNIDNFEFRRIAVFRDCPICQVEATSDFIVARAFHHRIAVINRRKLNAEICYFETGTEVASVAIADDTVFASTARWGIIAWNIETKKLIRLVMERCAEIYNSKTPNQLIYGSRRLKTVKIFDLETKHQSLTRSFAKAILDVYDHIVVLGDNYTIDFVHLKTGHVMASHDIYDICGKTFPEVTVESITFNFKHCVIQLDDGSTYILTFDNEELDEIFLDCLAP